MSKVDAHSLPAPLMHARRLLFAGPLGLTLGVLALLASACDRQAEVTTAASRATADAGPADDDIDAGPSARSPHPPVSDSATATTPAGLPMIAADASGSRDAGPQAVRRFHCDGGHQVELVGDGLARVTLADGRVIGLPRRSGGVAEYRGEALTFDVDDAGGRGVLGQDEVGGFDCTADG